MKFSFSFPHSRHLERDLGIARARCKLTHPSFYHKGSDQFQMNNIFFRTTVGRKTDRALWYNAVILKKEDLVQ